MKTLLDSLDSLPPIGGQVSLTHPISGEKVDGTIVVYTCSEDFEHVDGVNIKTEDGEMIECHLYNVEVA